jgi:hypothetical protein
LVCPAKKLIRFFVTWSYPLTTIAAATLGFDATEEADMVDCNE